MDSIGPFEMRCPLTRSKTVDDLSFPVTEHPGDPCEFTDIIKQQFGDEILYSPLSILRGGSSIDESIVDLLDHMKTVYADLCAGKVDISDILVELEHIHTDIFDIVTLFLADP